MGRAGYTAVCIAAFSMYILSTRGVLIAPRGAIIDPVVSMFRPGAFEDIRLIWYTPGMFRPYERCSDGIYACLYACIFCRKSAPAP